MKILVINGPNLNILGRRTDQQYGFKSLPEIEAMMKEEAADLEVEVEFFQSNHEGLLIDFIQAKTQEAEGIVINPGALTHYSYALRDALIDARLPVAEVHLSDINNREDWRSRSVLEGVAVARVAGQKEQSYVFGLRQLVHWIEKRSLGQNIKEDDQKEVAPVVCGVVGYPLDHSLSPVLHQAAYRKLGIQGLFIKLARKDLAKVIEAVKTLGLRQLSVTIPYKIEVMKYLDEIDEEAALLGAVNTVICQDGKLKGYNTDVAGIRESLKTVELSGREVVLVGAGGAARAVAKVVLERQGSLKIVNRTDERALKLALDVGAGFEKFARRASLRPDILINATPVGCFPRTEVSIWPREWMDGIRVVFDLVYNPVRTKLLRDAAAVGARTIDGLTLLIVQGQKALRLWSGQEVSSEYLRRVVIKHLKLAEGPKEPKEEKNESWEKNSSEADN